MNALHNTMGQDISQIGDEQNIFWNQDRLLNFSIFGPAQRCPIKSAPSVRPSVCL